MPLRHGMNQKLIPKRIQLEVFYGCNAKCTMCAVSLKPTRKVGKMPLEMSKYVLDQLAPHTDEIEKCDLFTLGEPLLDPHLFERISYAKKLGFKSVAISTNADLMTHEKQVKLLESGVDAVILSIDGVKKETHEGIRRGVKFERVLENSEGIIQLRDQGGYKTRFVVRFIYQDCNIDEWDPYKKFWSSRLSREKGDLLMRYDVNTMGGVMLEKHHLIKDKWDMDIERKSCHHVFQRMVVLVDGTVCLCCEDSPRATEVMGNVNQQSPMEIFNGERFNAVRKLHQEGEKNQLEVCKNCTVLYSERNLQNVDLPARINGHADHSNGRINGSGNVSSEMKVSRTSIPSK